MVHAKSGPMWCEALDAFIRAIAGAGATAVGAAMGGARLATLATG